MSSSGTTSRQADTTGRVPLMAFITDAASSEALHQYAIQHKLDGAILKQGGIGDAVIYLKSNKSPKILIVEIASAAEAPAQLDHLADVCEPGTTVIVTGKINEYSFYTWLLDVGIANYLLQPFNSAQLEAVMQRAAQVDTPVTPHQQNAHIIAVIGMRGGVGSTTVAVNLASLLATQYHHHTALLDFDPQQGAVAMALDLEPGRGLRDALEKPDRIDGLFMDRVMIKLKDTLSVLSAEESLDEILQPTATAAEALLRETMNKYAFIVIDLPRNLNSFVRFALQSANTILAVTEPTLLCMRDALRFSDFCRDTLKVPPPQFIGNKMGLAGKFQMTQQDFEKGLSAKLKHTIPFALEAYAASNEGQVLVDFAKKTPIAKAMEQIAADFCTSAEAHAPVQKKRFLGLGKGKR